MKTKAEQLIAALELFAESVAHVPDPKVKDLLRLASGTRQFIADAKNRKPRPTSSQIVAGLEQAVREAPRLIQEVGEQWRGEVSRAFRHALTLECPEFLTSNDKRLKKLKDRGSIRSESEFYLVRDQIDAFEGVPGQEDELKRLYALVDAYEA